jgi:putative ABC transport system permease protein
MALALVMLAGAGLLVRSLERLERVDLGYRAERLSMLELTFPFDRYNTAPKYMALFDRIFTRLRAVPGVVSLTPVIIPPFLGPNVWQWRPVVEGQSQAEADATPFIPVEGGNAEYFRTFGIPIVRGTDFSDADHDGAPAVAVVSEAVAQRLWPGQDAVGKHIRFNGLDSTLWRTVIGVAGDIRFRSLRDATPTIYMPWRQMGTQGTVAIRTSGDLSAALGAMRRAVAELDPQVRIWRARSMDDLLAGPLAQPRLSTLLLSTFGLTALLLAAIGLYGVMASAVREQTRELGVRMALGASPERIRRDVLSGALAVGGAGALAGLAVAVVATRFLVTLLYGVSPVDPVTLLSVCGLLVVVTMVASYVPARRATRIDPALALRADS